jgi:drug/metabolite transporter (DMT)-like permease
MHIHMSISEQSGESVSKNRKTYIAGLSFSLIGLVMMSIREVHFATILKLIPMPVLVFYLFILSLLIFNLFAYFKKSGLLHKIRKQWIWVVGVNITTALMWVCYGYALKFIEPAIAVGIGYSIRPLSTLIIGVWIIKNYKVTTFELYCALGVGLAILVQGWVTYKGYSGVGEINASDAVFGLIMVFIAGIMTTLNNVIAKRLGNSGYDAKDLMAIRFYGLVIVSSIIIFTSDLSFYVPKDVFIEIIGIALLGITIPIMFIQMSIVRVDINTSAMLGTLSPLITFIYQIFYGSYSFSLLSLLGISLSIIFVGINVGRKIVTVDKLKVAV